MVIFKLLSQAAYIRMSLHKHLLKYRDAQTVDDEITRNKNEDQLNHPYLKIQRRVEFYLNPIDVSAV